VQEGGIGCPRSWEIRREQRRIADDLEAGTFVIPT